MDTLSDEILSDEMIKV